MKVIVSKCKIFFTLLFCLFIIASAANAQTKTISGTVRSVTDNQLLAAVTIQVKGTSNSTATDAQGRYLLKNVSPSDSLIFSSVGFGSETVSVACRSLVNISLQVSDRTIVV